MKKQIWFVRVVLVLAALACTGTPSAMQILDEPVYVCPTATPRATDTPMPTSVQPPITVPPSGWATRTPVPGCIWNGFLCATNTPYPGGVYRTPGYTLPGATSTPRPTTTPYPTPTPFVMRPPQEFFVEDAIYTGGFVSSINVRLRLMNVVTLAASPAPNGDPRSLARWEVEIKNAGSLPYEVFPAWQMYVSTVTTDSGDIEGIWGASRDAAAEAGLTALLEAVMLVPGETRVFALAAYIPAGTVRRFAYALDPTTRPTLVTPGVPGTNVMVWTNTTNTVCAGELAEPPDLPTPLAPLLP